METILKSLVLYPSEKKIVVYTNDFLNFFQGRNRYFDQAFNLIQDYYGKYFLFPTLENIKMSLGSSGEAELCRYITEIVESPEVEAYPEDSNFITRAKVKRDSLFMQRTLKDLNLALTQIQTQETKDAESVATKIEELILKLTDHKNLVKHYEKSNSDLLYGPSAVEKAKIKYEEKKLKGNDVFFNLPIPGLEKVKVKPGDFITIGGFTSHGKSVVLRHMVYHHVVYYAHNFLLINREMDHDLVVNLFYFMHANNKNIFPDSPAINYEAFKEGVLTSEEEDFLFNVVIPDFVNNKAYGTLHVLNPKKTMYSLQDAILDIQDTENYTMPLHGVAFDYLTLFNPFPGGFRAKADFGAYNAMIVDAKNYAMTHTNRASEINKLFMYTAAQISREGLKLCIKNEEHYELTSTFKSYSEFETSSDVALTALLTPTMRSSNQLKIQCLKNRDGEVPEEPVIVACDFKKGFFISALESRSVEERAAILKTLDI